MSFWKISKKRLLLLFLPVVIIDILSYCLTLYRISDIDVLWLVEFIDSPSMFQVAGLPDSYIVLPILLQIVAMIWAWWAERDTLFLKILATKTTIFACIGYFSWYLKIWVLDFTFTHYSVYTDIVLDFLCKWYVIAANLVLLIIIILKDNLKQKQKTS